MVPSAFSSLFLFYFVLLPLIPPMDWHLVFGYTSSAVSAILSLGNPFILYMGKCWNMPIAFVPAFSRRVCFLGSLWEAFWYGFYNTCFETGICRILVMVGVVLNPVLAVGYCSVDENTLNRLVAALLLASDTDLAQ